MRSLPLALLLAALLAGCEALPPAQPQAATTPTAAPTTARPTATPIPAGDLLEQALALRDAGDYEAAAERFHDVAEAHPDAATARLASFYLAESFALREQWPSAASALAPLAEGADKDALAARALFLLARAYEAAGDPARAQAAYARYAGLGTPIAPYARARQAAQELALGRNDEAAAHFEQAAAGPIAPAERLAALERAAAARAALGQHAEASRIYAEVLAAARSPGYRATILLAAAASADAAGDQAARLDALREIVEQSPAAPEAAAAADQLRADPQGALDPAAAALVYASAERWDDARAQYDAAIASAEGEPQLELRRRRALTLRAGDSPDFPAAIAALDQILAEADPASDLARQAQLDRIQTVGQSGDAAAAIAAYRDYAAALPDDPRAPEALRRAAALLDRQGDSAAATDQQLDLIRRYPASEQAADARFPAALALYRAGRRAEAAAIWEQQAAEASPTFAAQGAYWAGRAYGELGDRAKGDSLLRRAATLAPDSYYGVRAAERLGGDPAARLDPASALSPADWGALAAWADPTPTPETAAAPASGTPAPTPQASPTPQPPATSPDLDAALARAAALGDVGLRDEARGEWRAALALAGDSGAHLVAVARRAEQERDHAVALDAAEQLEEAGGGREKAPGALRRLLYPAPYREAVGAAAREQDVDPLLLYALVRQESRFDPGATSSAGAIGLTQVMPETAAGIAQRLGVEGFQRDDLYRPGLSVRFGARYIGVQLRQFDKNLLAALAAYNGGPGNAERWLAGPGAADPDLFVEGIDYGETRLYVKIVYANYRAYQRLYAAQELAP